MPIVEGLEADHHKYVIDGVIDHEVVERQSRIQATKLGESSVIHYHKQDEPCGKYKHDDYGNVKKATVFSGELLPKVNKPIV